MLSYSLSGEYFNPPSREGSDITRGFYQNAKSGFQSTLPRGERHSFRCLSSGFISFQSTLPRGERRRRSVPGLGSKEFQSTLPRGEQRSRSVCSLCLREISIHAPARGATLLYLVNSTVRIISIHAPARGATKHSKGHCRTTTQFQSTLPRGERRTSRTRSLHY